MSHTVSVEEAASKLSQLVSLLKPGDEIVLTEDNQPVARIVPSDAPRPQRRPGTCRGMLTIKSEDEEHLKDFAEYMP